MSNRFTLSPDDWIKAAFRALSAGGPQAIKAEAIARDLKVSKGSFYWHFRDVPALKTAMLGHWATRATAQIIADVEANADHPRDRLRLLVGEATGDRSHDYGGEIVEGAIRDWARYDTEAARAVIDVDRRRIAYLVGLFRACGDGDSDSATKARILYAGLVGLSALAQSTPIDLGADLRALLERLLTD